RHQATAPQYGAQSILITLFLSASVTRTVLHTLSLHDALPISSTEYTSPPTVDTSACAKVVPSAADNSSRLTRPSTHTRPPSRRIDRKSTRLNSSHGSISYAVFCL